MTEHDNQFFGSLRHLLIEAGLRFRDWVLRTEQLIVFFGPFRKLGGQLDNAILSGLDIRVVVDEPLTGGVNRFAMRLVRFNRIANALRPMVVSQLGSLKAKIIDFDLLAKVGDIGSYRLETRASVLQSRRKLVQTGAHGAERIIEVVERLLRPTNHRHQAGIYPGEERVESVLQIRPELFPSDLNIERAVLEPGLERINFVKGGGDELRGVLPHFSGRRPKGIVHARHGCDEIAIPAGD